MVLSVVVGDCYLAVIVSVKHTAEFSAYALDRTEHFDFDVSADKLHKMLVTHKLTLKPRRAYLKAICTLNRVKLVKRLVNSTGYILAIGNINAVRLSI